MSTLRRLVLNAFVPLAAWTASSVVTVSEFSKSEILSATPVSSDDVSVVYNPLPPELPEPSGNGTEDVDNPYLLSVGNNYPHKNLDRLIEALPSIERELSLVIVGFSLNSDEELQRRADILDVGNRVHFCEQVSQQELANLYSGAEAYVHPSKYEGFGLPLIEAMYYETPVVAHKAAAIPEIAGDAAIYISDCKAESIAQGVAEARDEDKKEALIERGRENLDRFSLTAFINNLETTLIKSLRK